MTQDTNATTEFFTVKANGVNLEMSLLLIIMGNSQIKFQYEYNTLYQYPNCIVYITDNVNISITLMNTASSCVHVYVCMYVCIHIGLKYIV